MASLKRRTNVHVDRADADLKTGNVHGDEKENTNSSDINKPSKIDNQSTGPPINPLKWLAVLYHFTLSVFYLLLFYYSHMLLAGKQHLLDPKGVIPEYGGPFKFLTHIHQWLQLVFFTVQFLTDILPESSIKKLLQSVCDFTFTTIVFPMALSITISFWSIYAVDRDLIYPESFDSIVPLSLNHFWHTTIALWVILDVFLCFRHYPSSGVAASVNFIVNAAYQAWVVWVFVKTGFWVYGILGVLPPHLLALYFGINMFISFGFYLVGKAIARARWGQTI